MITELFITFLAFSFGLIVYGFISQHDIFRIIGVTLLFLISISLSPTIPDVLPPVEYKTGFTEVVSGNTTTVEYQYTEFKSHTLSFYMLVLSILTLIVIFFDRRTPDIETY